MRDKMRVLASYVALPALLLSVAVLVSQCGNSSRDIDVVSEGFFIGSATGGGDLSIAVGSIERIFFDCNGQDIISPHLNEPINADGSFDVEFDVDSTTYRVQGQFTDDNSVSGSVSTVGGTSPCDGSFLAVRCSGSQDCSDTDGDNIPDEVDPEIGPPVTTTTTSSTTTTTGAGGTTTTTSSTTSTTSGGGGTTTTSTTTTTTTTTTTSTTTTTTLGGLACPDVLTFEGNADDSDLDPGWSGQSHDAHVIGQGQLSFAISGCAGSTRPNCGQCNLSGPVANPSAIAKANNQRCNGDSSIECTGDSDCSGNGTCEFFFGAPLPLSAGGVSTCVINEVSGSTSGTVNIEAGSGSANVSLISRVFNGIVTAQPCPTCDGDSVPFDGNRTGTCNGGERDGSACDISGRHPFEDSFGSTSFDCPPLPGAKIADLSIPLNTTTGTASMVLSGATPKCRAPGFKQLRCLCSEATGAASAPNSCEGGATDCLFTPSDTNSADEGHCITGPFDQICNLETFRGCFVDSDCPAPGDSCGGKFRECFTTDGTTTGDPDVVAQGNPDPPSPVATGTTSNPTIVSLFCIGATSASAVNSVAGLPGLGRLTLGGTATLSGP